MTPKRKLAAILFADIAGYTVRSSQDESLALRVREGVERLVKSSALSHHGRIVKTMGDGTMLEFASAVEAVSCALDVQEQMEVLNQEFQLEEPVAVRIGVHVGDVVEEDDDLYGNAVNIASRVHAMAEPGGVCITREVYVQIRPILKLQCAPISAGSSRMPEAVEVFQVLGGLPSRARVSSPRYALFAGLGLLVAVVGLAAIFFSDRSSGPLEPLVARGGEQRRLLLPDWVTPGEWFAIGGGRDLNVYFGDRPAQMKMEDGRLMVQAPLDLPTQQTTISVFEGQNADPLVRQQTQVIRAQRLAMNEPVPSGKPLLEMPGNSLRADLPVQTAGPPPSEKAPTGKPANGKPLSSKGEPPVGVVPNIPPAPDAPGKAVLVQVGPESKRTPLPPAVEEKLMTSVLSGEPVMTEVEIGELKAVAPAMKGAMGAMSMAQRGQLEEARRAIQQAREELKQSKHAHGEEIEAMLKMVEASLAEPVKNGPQAGRKWAEAFAYEMNHSTRNLAGIAMISRLVRMNKMDEAKRAIHVVKSRGSMTQQEKEALAKLEQRIVRHPSMTGKAP